MQLLFDFFPLLLFFAAYWWQGIYFATGVAIVASIAQIAWLHWKHGRAGIPQWLSLVIIVVFGGATLILQDKTFILWKPTVLYGLFGTILAVGKLGFGRDLLQHVMKGIVLPPPVWTQLTWAWVAFFAFMGVANWYVAFHYSEQTWVLYKVWGGIGLFFVFALAQGLWLSRHMPQEEST
jgi:intracellular septation protein